MKKNNNETEVVEDIYGDHGKVYKPQDRRILFASIALAVVFGAIAGLVGDVLSRSYLNEIFYGAEFPLYLGSFDDGNNNNGDFLSVEPVSAQDFNEIEKRIHQTARSVEKSIVSVYQKKEQTGNLFEDMYFPSEQLGNGVVLTSDGWILSNDRVLAPGQEHIVVSFGNQVYDVERVVYDSVSGAVFLKVAANRMPVVEFGVFDELRLGQMLLAMDSNSHLTVVHLQSTNASVVVANEDALLNSDRIEQYLLVDRELGREFEGSPLFTLDGEVVGVLNNVSDTEMFATAIALESFRSVIADVFRNGEVVRPFFGVAYRDLSQVVLDLKTVERLGFSVGSQPRGAYVSAEIEDAAGEGVRSSAFASGLAIGDIILKVNNDVLDANYTLSQIVHEYQPGDLLTLSLLRKGKELTLDVILLEEGKIEADSVVDEDQKAAE